METGNGRELFRPAAYCSPDGAGQAGGVLAGPTACWPGRQRAPPLDSVLPRSTAHIPDILPPRCFRGIISKMCVVRGPPMAGYAGSAGAHLGYPARRRRTSRVLCREFAGVAGYRGSALIRGRPNRRAWQDTGEVRCPGGATPGERPTIRPISGAIGTDERTERMGDGAIESRAIAFAQVSGKILHPQRQMRLQERGPGIERIHHGPSRRFAEHVLSLLFGQVRCRELVVQALQEHPPTGQGSLLQLRDEPARVIPADGFVNA